MANTQTAPPCGTSPSKPCPGNCRARLVWMPAPSPPQPTLSARYCLPSTMNVDGGATTPELTGYSQSILPVLASNAWILRSAVPPLNTRPPAVARTPPQLTVLPRPVVHTFCCVSTFQACSSPIVTVFGAGVCAPM